MIKKNPFFCPVSESQNEDTKDGSRLRNDIFNSLGYSTNNSLFYELQTCSRQTKYKRKHFFFLHKNLPEIAMSLQKLTATGSIDNLIIWLWK